MNSRATQRVLNNKLSKDSCTLSTVGAAKPRATQQVQHVLCHAVDLVGVAKPRAALRPLNKNSMN